MLTTLCVRNFVILERLEIDFQKGLTVFTGETGAGKTILFDAIKLITGGRSDSRFVRSGAEKAEIQAYFDISHLPILIEKLAQYDIEAKDELLIKRVLSKEGRSKAFINEQLVTINLLQQVGKYLVDIYAQNTEQRLRDSMTQLAILDSFSENEKRVQDINHLYEQWHYLNTITSHDNEDRYTKEIHFLEYQIEELEQAAPGESEWQELEHARKKKQSYKQLLELSFSITQQLNGETGIYQQIAHIQKNAHSIEAMDSKATELQQHLGKALLYLQEVETFVSNYQQVDWSEDVLQKMEARCDLLFSLARKHKINPEQLPKKMDELQKKLIVLRNGLVDTEKRQADKKNLQLQYQKLADTISTIRKKNAPKFSQALSKRLKKLAMPDVQFNIAFEAFSDNSLPRSYGYDRVKFMLSTNKGEEPSPLHHVASGGELSRLGIAIRLLAHDYDTVPLLLLDEVDSGIGGETAILVGEMLQQLSQGRQVLCISHLPQVSAFADHHYLVHKRQLAQRTITDIDALTYEAKIKEIARMLGGKVTAKTMEAAKELLEKYSSSNNASVSLEDNIVLQGID